MLFTSLFLSQSQRNLGGLARAGHQVRSMLSTTLTLAPGKSTGNNIVSEGGGGIFGLRKFVTELIEIILLYIM